MPEVRTNWNRGQPIPARDMRTNSQALAGLVQSAQDGTGKTVPPDQAYKVKVTARVSEGEFNFEEVRYSKSEGKYKTVPGGVTHATFGTITAQGGQVEGGAGLVFIGDIVTIRPGGEIDSSGRVRWEFVPGTKEMPVDLTQAGGSNGDDTNPPSYTYDCYAEDGELILPAASPQIGRPDRGPVSSVATKGIVAYELVAGVPTKVLRWANEGYRENTGYENAEGAAGEISSPTVGGSGSQFNNGTMTFLGATDASTPTTHIPVRTFVEDETSGDPATETGKTRIIQWVDAADIPGGSGGGDNTGITTVDDGTTSVTQANNGTINLVDTANSGTLLGVSLSVTNNGGEADVSGTVDASDLEVGGVGGSGGASVFNKTFRVDDGAATGVRTLDGDDYSGRTLDGVIQHHAGAIVGWQQDNFNNAVLVSGKMGSAPVADYRLVNEPSYEIFIDASDGSKLKLDVKTSPSGSYYHFDCLITKGARKTSPDTTFS
ncbi:MAG: hypothetical protein AAGI37_15435 [Planctomycetota bacterium]